MSRLSNITRYVIFFTACVVSQTIQCSESKQFESWSKLRSIPGQCHVCFPLTPEHITKSTAHPETDNELLYDLYIAGLNTDVVFMMLVAECPGQVDPAYAEAGLQSFINSLLTQNAHNKLVYADLVQVDNQKGVDFCIQTGDVHFKGRAIMGDNNILYLLACECNHDSFDPDSFNYFVNSFQLTQSQ